MQIYTSTYEKYLLTCTPNEDSNQPVQTCSLIRVFVVRMKTHWILSYPKYAQWRLITLREWSGWSKSLLDAHIRRYVFSCSAHLRHGEKKCHMSCPNNKHQRVYQAMYSCSLSRTFSISRYILKYPVILWAYKKSPNRTVNAQVDRIFIVRICDKSPFLMSQIILIQTSLCCKCYQKVYY